MPTVGELLKSATKMEYDFGGAKVTIERRSRTVVETPKKEESGREEYFRLRDSVWTRIRSELRKLEDFQRYLKKRTKISPHDLHHSKYFRKMIAAELANNTERLRNMYLVIEFTRRGTKVPGAERAEKFFNEFFSGKHEFRNQYWTYWNKKHNQSAKKIAARVTVKSDNKPFRCPDCNSFVSRKSNFCSRCGKKVSPK